MLATGVVVAGRRTAEFAGYWGGDHHDGVEIFVPTHQTPAENPFERVHFVPDGITECVRRATKAAGGRDVMLHGAYTAQEALKAGVLDAIELQLRPVLLGQGRRLFDGLPAELVELDLVRVLEAPGTLHLRYDVTGEHRRPGAGSPQREKRNHRHGQVDRVGAHDAGRRHGPTAGMVPRGRGLQAHGIEELEPPTRCSWAGRPTKHCGLWPSATGRYADLVNPIPKYVASRTLSGPLEWNAQLLGPDTADAVAAAKEKHEGSLISYGCGALATFLAHHGLVDEVRVWLHPVVWGEGVRSFHAGRLPLRLRLITASPYDSGVVRLSYAPVGE